MSDNDNLVNVIIDNELRAVVLHPCVICGDVLADVDDSGKQIHVRQVFNKFVCEACFQRLADEFGVETFDPHPFTAITEIAFPNDFTVYTTSSNINEAINKAKKWYTSRFDGDLGEPVVSVIGNTIYTSDPYDIVIPEEGEGNE